MVTFEDKRRWRAAFMQELYELTGGDHWSFQNAQEIVDKIGVPSDESRSLVQYLEGEYLLECHWTAGPQLPTVQITHFGVREVEQALANPDSPTEHFAPISTINIHGNVYGSQVGIAGGDLTQGFTFSTSKTEALQCFVAAYEAALPHLGHDERDLARQHLAQVKAEIAQSTPRAGVLNALVASLKTFALAAMSSAGSSAGGMVWQDVLHHIY